MALLPPYRTPQGTVGDLVSPLYADRWRQRMVNALSYLGGTLYIGQNAITTDWAYPATEATEGDATTGRTVIRTTTAGFLKPGPREQWWDFQNRRSASVFRNFTAPVADTLAAFVQSRPVRRDPGASASLRAAGFDSPTAGDADWRGSSWDEFMREALRTALVGELCHVIVDWPYVPLDENGTPLVQTLLDEQQAKLRPYARIVSPLQIPLWREDEFGNLIACEILEPDMRSTDADPWGLQERAPLSRLWYRDRWELREGGPTGRLLAEASHPYGRVPIETLYVRRSGGARMFGVTPLDDIAHLNWRLYNRDSILSVLEGVQMPFLSIPGGAHMGVVEVGTSAAFTPPADAPHPAWIAPSPESIRVLRESNEEDIRQIRARAGMGRGTAEQSIASRSGEALLIETSERTVVVTALAAEAADFERRFAALWCEVAGEGEFDGGIEYPASYDLTALDDQIRRATDIGRLPEVPRAVQRALVDRLWHNELSALPDEERECIEAEVEAERGEHEAEVVTLPAAAVPSNGAHGMAAEHEAEDEHETMSEE